MEITRPPYTFDCLPEENPRKGTIIVVQSVTPAPETGQESPEA